MEKDYLQDFLDTKELAGRSDRTIELYELYINALLYEYEEKSPLDIDTDDIKHFLAKYKRERNVSNATLDLVRRIIMSFYSYLQAEGKINKNPVQAIDKIKVPKVIKKPFTEEELEIVRETCKDAREEALVETLYATGVRVGELSSMNIKDIDFLNRKATVIGKGNKEREVYFTVKSIRSLKRYLESRSDKENALFVSKQFPYPRLETHSIESIIRNIGKRCNIKCHPHKFRRTLATNLLNRGMPLEQVSKLLGHNKLETTLVYVTIEQDEVKRNYNKFV